jgi:hypothetical protein
VNDRRVRRFAWPVLGLAVLAFFLVRHFTRTPPFSIRYTLTEQGRALLGSHALAFDAGALAGGSGDVYLVSNAGLHRLTDAAPYPSSDSLSDYTTAGEPSIAPDGRYIAFFKSNEDGDGDVFVMRPDGSGSRKLTGLPSAAHATSAPSWDPGSRSVLVAAEEEIPGLAGKKPGTPAYNRALKAGFQNLDKLHTQVFRLGLDGHAVQGTHDRSDHSQPLFSPDGRAIAYIREGRINPKDFSGPRNSLWLAHSDGSAQRRLLKFKGLTDDKLHWLADGHTLALHTFGWPRNARWYFVDTRSAHRAKERLTFAHFGFVYSDDRRLAAFLTDSAIMLAPLEQGKLGRPVALVVAHPNRKPELRGGNFDGVLSLR